MKTQQHSGAKLSLAHTGRFRVVTYEELRDKATSVAEQILDRYVGQAKSIVVAPILMGGGMPARLVIDALLGYGIVREVVPCRIRRYTAIGVAGAVEFTAELSAPKIQKRVVVGIDDLVDGGETLAAFIDHALELGASSVETAVIFAKPHSVVAPTYCAERGIDEWLVMPGEEHDFMRTMVEADPDVAALAPAEMLKYFVGLGLLRSTALSWQRLSVLHGGTEA